MSYLFKYPSNWFQDSVSAYVFTQLIGQIILKVQKVYKNPVSNPDRAGSIQYNPISQAVLLS